jgi:hypothetical protein
VSEKQTVELYRIENPSLKLTREPDGVTSHVDLRGQWFSPSLDAALVYLRKSTQTFGREGRPVEGARLVVAHVPSDALDGYHVAKHPITSGMDVEDDNYIIPRDGTVPMDVVALDETLGDLRGDLARVSSQLEAKQRVRDLLGHLTLKQ